MSMPLFDYATSQQLRDRGMSQAASRAGNAWLEAAVEDFVLFLKAGPAPLERWREDWLKRGKPEPPSHNAYGSVTRIAAGRGLIRHTGRFLSAKAVATRGHRVMEWEVSA